MTKTNKLYFKKTNIITCLFTCIVFISSSVTAAITEDDCSTRKIQIMKPEYPYTTFQGYSIVSYSINNDGSVSNIKVAESKCAVSRGDDGSINFKSCPFFKKVSVDAAKYLKFLPPKDSNDNACSIKNHTHRYTYRFYEGFLDDKNQFLLRDEANLILDQDFKSDEERKEFVKKVLNNQL